MRELDFSKRTHVNHLLLRSIAMMFLIIVFVSCNRTKKPVSTLTGLYSIVSASKAGDTIVIANGNWEDVLLEIKNAGTESAPIVIRAEEAGKVVFSANSRVSISGEYVELHGILFADGSSGAKPVISFRSGDKVATNSRVTNCAISYYNPSDRFLKANWVELYGRNNRVDHCSFVGKLNAGVTFVVKLNGEKNQQNNHLIDHNYFGERPRLGSNGGETMRVGTSTFSLSSSNTRIINNYFEHCNGEVEIISIKACDNLVQGNTFCECEGVLTLRHGNNNTITENIFIGNHVPNTGGVRVINAGHTIRNNHFQELDGHRFRSAFGVMNGVPNSAINRYHQVKDARLDNNAFFNCENLSFGLGSDNERTARPKNTTFHNNIIYHPDSKKLIIELDDMSGISFADNDFHTSYPGSKKGFYKAAMIFEKDENGFYANNDYRVDLKASKDNTGAAWYKKAKKVNSASVTHKASTEDIQRVLAEANEGDIISISDDIILSSPLEIRKSISLIGEIKQDGNPVLKYVNNRDRDPLIIIMNGGELRMKNLDIDGASKDGIALAGIITQKEPAIEHYNLFADNCSFYNFSEGRRTAFQAFKSTFADSIVFTNCTFHTISGLGINLKAEKEDLGKYNAEYVILKNCIFYNVMGSAIDLYRGGNDESTTGPSLLIDHCTFHNVENKELGSAINLTGVQEVTITNNIFSHSGKSGRVIHMEDQQWIRCHIENNNFYKSGRFESYYDGRLGKNNWYLNPGFVSEEDNDYRLKPGSVMNGRSTNNTALGYSN